MAGSTVWADGEEDPAGFTSTQNLPDELATYRIKTNTDNWADNGESEFSEILMDGTLEFDKIR